MTASERIRAAREGSSWRYTREDRVLVARLMAAIETPDDLTPEDIEALLEDAQALLDK